jgi:ribosomal protein S18
MKQNRQPREFSQSGGPGRSRRRKTSVIGVREQTQCRFCRGGIKYIDYKDVDTLQRLLTNRGKIYSRKRSNGPLNEPGI